MSQLALIVDDEPDLRRLISISLGRMEITCKQAGDIEQAKQLLNQHDFDLCLTDMRLPDGNGIDLVEFIQVNFPSIPVAVITAYGNMETAVRALKSGAFDFIAKPIKLDTLKQIVSAAIRAKKDVSDTLNDELDELLGDSQVMCHLRTMIRKVARGQSPVYIRGNTGTGKELVAQLIHRCSGRKQGPWIPINCGAIPAELMESEFFGHKKGSFTGAHQDKIGLFEAASGGTLFLDEIAELPMEMQVKLLRAIQERKIKPIGNATEISVDVRVLCATHADLAEQVEKGQFRNDLYYRLNVIELEVPDLKDRCEDIPLLAGKILEQLNKQDETRQIRLSDEALAQLKAHSFPGNIRELENILERAYTLCETSVIGPGEIMIPAGARVHEEAHQSFPLGSMPLDDHLADIEKTALIDAIDKAGGNKTAAAELLGMSFRSLRYKLKKYGIND